MIISEKQIHQLMAAAHTLMAIADAAEEVRDHIIESVRQSGSGIAELLADIVLQQSEELKEIK